MILGFIPAKLESERLQRKNLQEIGDGAEAISLIRLAIKKAIKSNIFDQVWVSSSSVEFAEIAKEEGALFHLRTNNLPPNEENSHDYNLDFYLNHNFEWLFEIQTVTPLFTVKDIQSFVRKTIQSSAEFTTTSSEEILEFYKVRGEKHSGGSIEPINFDVKSKSNSQDLDKLYRFNWAISGRKKSYFIKNKNELHYLYPENSEFFSYDKYKTLTIKDVRDLEVCRRLYSHKDVFQHN